LSNSHTYVSSVLQDARGRPLRLDPPAKERVAAAKKRTGARARRSRMSRSARMRASFAGSSGRRRNPREDRTCIAWLRRDGGFASPRDICRAPLGLSVTIGCGRATRVAATARLREVIRRQTKRIRGGRARAAPNDRPVSAKTLARASVRGTPWRVDEIRSAGRASYGRRQARSFNRSSKPAITEIDVWCSLS